jgi:hypothetical protein
MDNNTVDILRGMYLYFCLLPRPHFSHTCKVALFLLCMPVLAAPLQAIAVLCKLGLISYSGNFMMIQPARFRLERRTGILHYKSE